MSHFIYHKRLFPAEIFYTIFKAWNELDDMSIIQSAKKLGYCLHTLFLFTRSDWKTMMFPVSTFAAIAGPVTSFEKYFLMLFWVWTHLLQFNCANQAYSGDEDIVNKPWRPVPARRITPENTMRLRWTLFPLNLAFSYSIGTPVLYTTMFLTFAEYLYNEMGCSNHPVLKNVLNVAGYGGFKMGATLIASLGLQLDDIALQALTLSCSVIFTTIHAQDFPDYEGDRLAGRHTLPILYPKGARVYITAILVGWSVALSMLWNLGAVCSIVYIAVGSFIAWRFFTKREVKQDEKTYLLYNVSILPSLQTEPN
ncbi:integral membrane protein [Moniliophthora roreri MCA 2997]|uniref:Integral membrane protein n=1 Tax=Moniliophthora roreri (strain MCA 2997) TaxID=1381753 RepID=V2XCI0_MONRO|nr:integral membrane protein [Moniliophthora roreri MCA 2997]